MKLNKINIFQPVYAFKNPKLNMRGMYCYTSISIDCIVLGTEQIPNDQEVTTAETHFFPLKYKDF